MPYACVYIFLAFVFHRGTLRVAKRAAEYIYLKNDPDSWVPFQNTKWRIKYKMWFIFQTSCKLFEFAACRAHGSFERVSTFY